MTDSKMQASRRHERAGDGWWQRRVGRGRLSGRGGRKYVIKGPRFKISKGLEEEMRDFRDLGEREI